MIIIIISWICFFTVDSGYHSLILAFLSFENLYYFHYRLADVEKNDNHITGETPPKILLFSIVVGTCA